jgi:hypothetical protein
MMMNEHTVFVRTEAGQQALRDANSELPRSVRTLLFSIDGRSLAGSYVALLPNFGNVYALLDFLHQAGYITEKPPSRRRRAGLPAPAANSFQTSQQHSQPFDPRASAPDSRPSGQVTSRFAASQLRGQPADSRPLESRPLESRFSESQQPTLGDANPVATRTNPAMGVGGLLRKVFGRKPRVDDGAARFASASQAFGGSSLQEPFTHPGSAVGGETRQPSFSGGSSFYPTTTAVTELPPLRPEPEAVQFDLPAAGLTHHLTQQATPRSNEVLHEPDRLQAARDLMADFLYAYLPAIAHDACLSINALQTREQMLASLPDYSQLVSRTGEMGTAHLAQLHATLGWD